MDAAVYESLWKEYPSHIGKKAAFAHMRKTIRTPSDVADCRRALANYKASRRVADGFIQNGSTWFNNWRDWIDYVEPQRGHRPVGGQDFEGTER